MVSNRCGLRGRSKWRGERLYRHGFACFLWCIHTDLDARLQCSSEFRCGELADFTSNVPVLAGLRGPFLDTKVALLLAQ